MTKTADFEKAHRLATKGDFSFFDDLYHDDFRIERFEIAMNREDYKAVYARVSDLTVYGPVRVLFENNHFLCHTVLMRENLGNDIFDFSEIMVASTFKNGMVASTFKNGQVIHQHSVFEKLDSDPSEGQDWNWEDYE